MTFESDLVAALGALVDSRVYPDVAPADAVPPYITYQQVGGAAPNFLESAVVGKRNARMQLNCWAETRIAANALARSVEDTLVVSTTLRAHVLGALAAVHDVGLYGTRQDFSLWH